MMRYGGKLIHRCRDAQGPIEVVETHGIRSLHFGTDARQSAMALAAPERLELSYLRAMLTALALIPEPRRILVLGLGGGSLVRFLLRHYPAVHLDAVEARAAMVTVARDYFGLPDAPGLHLHLCEAGDYLDRLANAGAAGYDLLLIDLFDDAGLAPVVMRHDFFAAATGLLQSGGAVCVNLWSGHAESFRAVMRLLKLYFPGSAYSLPVPGRGNVIGLGLKPEHTLPRLRDGLLKAQSLESRHGIEYARLLQRLAPPLAR